MRTSLEIDSSQWPELWRAAYQILEQTVVPSQLRAWIQPLEMVSTESHDRGLRIRFMAPNDFLAQWVRDRYVPALEAAFTQVTGSPCQITLDAKAQGESTPADGVLAGEPFPASVAPALPAEPQISAAGTPGPAMGVVIQAGNASVRSPIEAMLDPKYTLDSFVADA
jgi:chromosomal replication initiation ATPase DnaA